MSLPTTNSNAPWAQSRNCIIFSLISIIQGILVITVEAVIYSIISGIRGASKLDEKGTDVLFSLLIYLLIFMGSQIFQVIISIESVFFKNTLQIFGVIAFNVMALVYSVFQCYQIETAKRFGPSEFEGKKTLIFTLVGIVSGTITVGQILLSIFGFRLFKEFGWSIYLRLGSDLTMRRYFMTYHLLLMFLKFDLFFFFGFILQFLIFTISENDSEFWITMIFIPVSLLVGFLSITAVQQENTHLTFASLFGLATGVAYFIFKIFRLLTWPKYANFKYFLSLFAFLALFVIVTSAILLFSCYRNYHKGLSPYIKLSIKSHKSKAVRPISLNLEGE